MHTRIYNYGYGGWDEILDVRLTGRDYPSAYIVARAVDGTEFDRRVRHHCTALATDMLALSVPAGHPIQWSMSAAGRAESAAALQELMRQYPHTPKWLLTKSRYARVRVYAN